MSRFNIINEFLTRKLNGDQKELFFDLNPRMEFTILPNGTKTKEGWNLYELRSKEYFIPENDKKQLYDLGKYSGRIGFSGWEINSAEDKSDGLTHWLGFDFDLDKDNHKGNSNTCTGEELKQIIKVLKKTECGTLFRSTGGEGIHFYVRLEKPVSTSSRSEHAYLGRQIIDNILKDVKDGEFVISKLDHIADNLWIYGDGVVKNAFKCISKGKEYKIEGDDWKKDMPDSIKKKYSRSREVIGNTSFYVHGYEFNYLDFLYCTRLNWTQYNFIKRLISAEGNSILNGDRVTTHTTIVQEVCESMELPFSTVSEGTDKYSPNSFVCFSMNSIDVYRFGNGVGENHLWKTTDDGLKRYRIPCGEFYRELDTDKKYKKSGKKLYDYETYLEVSQECLNLGVELPDVPFFRENHGFIIEFLGNRFRLIAIFLGGANQFIQIDDWTSKRSSKENSKFFEIPVSILSINKKMLFYMVDAELRFVTVSDEKSVFYINNGKNYVPTIDTRINDSLKGRGMHPDAYEQAKTVTQNNGYQRIIKHFDEKVILNYEDPNTGIIHKRGFNEGARLRYRPLRGSTIKDFPLWLGIFEHLFSSLDEEIKKNKDFETMGIKTGVDFGLMWMAVKVQNPTQALPSLCFYSPDQNTGKSSLGVFARTSLFTKGCVSIKTYFTSEFSDCIDGCIIGLIDDVNLGKSSCAEFQNKAKVLATDTFVTLHPKGLKPRDIVNNVGIIQTANNLSELPIPDGDSRNIVIKVQKLKERKSLEEMTSLCRKEAPSFLGFLVDMELPESKERSFFPHLDTISKSDIMNEDSGGFRDWLESLIFKHNGEVTEAKVLYESYTNYACQNQYAQVITKQSFYEKLETEDTPCGKYGKSNTKHFGNISLAKETLVTDRITVKDGDRLKIKIK